MLKRAIIVKCLIVMQNCGYVGWKSYVIDTLGLLCDVNPRQVLSKARMHVQNYGIVNNGDWYRCSRGAQRPHIGHNSFLLEFYWKGPPSTPCPHTVIHGCSHDWLKTRTSGKEYENWIIFKPMLLTTAGYALTIISTWPGHLYRPIFFDRGFEVRQHAWKFDVRYYPATPLIAL